MTLKQNGRSVWVGAILALAVLSGIVVFAGPASATHGPTTRGGETWYPSNATGSVGPGATIFQGESGIQTIAAGNGSASDFRHQETGAVLSVPIPDDQPTGTYEAQSNGDTLVVETPEIADVEFIGPDGHDVAGSSLGNTDGPLTVRATYNYGAVSDLGLQVTADERSYTNAAVPDHDNRTNGTVTDRQYVSFPFETYGLPSQEYTVTLTEDEGWLDGDLGTVRDTVQVYFVHPAEIDMNPDEVALNETTRIDVANGREGERYLLSIPREYVATDGEPAEVFGASERKTTTGVTESHAYAVVEIEGGIGDATVRATDLAAGGATIELRGPLSNESISDGGIFTDRPDSTRTLEVVPAPEDDPPTASPAPTPTETETSVSTSDGGPTPAAVQQTASVDKPVTATTAAPPTSTELAGDDTEDESNGTSPSPESNGRSGPGFGVAVAIACLFCASIWQATVHCRQ